MKGDDLISVVEVALSFLIALTFVVLYAANNRWWRNRTGRGIMAMMGVITAVLTLSVMRTFLVGPAPIAECRASTQGAEWFVRVRLITFGLVPAVLAVWPLAAYIRVLVYRHQGREGYTDDKTTG